MSELLEIIMVLSFGASWPLNVMKSYQARTTKGKSLGFLPRAFLLPVVGIGQMSMEKDGNEMAKRLLFRDSGR